MIDITTIQSKEWAVDATRPLDCVVESDAAIAQEIALLINLPIGSVPGDPEKGIDMESVMDKPLYQQVPILVRMIREKVARYIPRIVVDRVECRPDGTRGDLRITVLWHYRADDFQQRATEVPYVR